MNFRSGTLWGCFGGLCLLAGVIAVYPWFRESREKGRRTACASNLKQIGLAIFEYAQDYDGSLPAVESPSRHATWKTDLIPYLKSKALFSCPSRDEAQFGPDGFPVSYAANTTGVGRITGDRGPFAPSKYPFNLNDAGRASEAIAVCEVENTTHPGFNLDAPAVGPKVQTLYAGHDGGSNYLFLDGRVSRVPPLGTNGGKTCGCEEPRNMWYIDSSFSLSPGAKYTLAAAAHASGS